MGDPSSKFTRPSLAEMPRLRTATISCVPTRASSNIRTSARSWPYSSQSSVHNLTNHSAQQRQSLDLANAAAIVSTSDDSSLSDEQPQQPLPEELTNDNSSALLSFLKTLQTCSICSYEKLTVDCCYILKCSHLMCKQCLFLWINEQQSSQCSVKKQKFYCPVCRQRFKNIVYGLYRNRAIVRCDNIKKILKWKPTVDYKVYEYKE